MSKNEIPAAVLNEVNAIEDKAKHARELLRQAAEEFAAVAAAYRDLDQRHDGAEWYGGGYADEAKELGEFAGEVGGLVEWADER